MRNAAPPPPVSTKTSFGDFLPFDGYMRIADNVMSRDDSEVSRQAYWSLLREVFAPALQGYLLALRDQGILQPIQGGDGHRIGFMERWNAMVATGLGDLGADEARWAWQTITDRFAHHFAFNATYPAKLAREKGEDADTLHRSGYEGMVAGVDGGRIEWWQMSSEAQCRVDDVRYKLDVDGWRIRLGRIDISANGAFIEIAPIAPPVIEAFEVEFRTGELLVADWFRIPEFTEATEAVRGGTASINSANGTVAMTAAYLRELGFVSVCVGNTSPDVLAVDGTLTFGHVDEDREEGWPEGVQKLGDTCTDLWWVTIIERAKLVEIVARTVGAEEAERKVAEYLAEEGYGLTQLTVEPGRHHLYFHGESEEFNEGFHSPDLAIPDGVEPMFVLSPRPLARRPRPDAEVPTAGGRVP